MENFTIHIFGYGETQLISKENNDKYATDKLTKVTALVDAVWALKPAEVTGEKKYQVIHFFNHNDIRWLGEESFNLKDEENLIKPEYEPEPDFSNTLDFSNTSKSRPPR